MNLRPKLVKLALISGVLTSSLLSWGGNAKANDSLLQSGTSEPSKLVFVFKEGTELSTIVESIKEQDKQSELESLDAISTLSIKPSTEEQGTAVIKLVQDKYQNILEEVGEDQEIQPANIFSVDLLQSSLSVSSFVTQSSAIAQSSTYSRAAISSVEEDVYKMWNWDIEDVTRNGASLSIEQGNHDVKIAIIDSGLDFNHPDLKDNIISEGKSFVEGVTDTQDYMGHGTMVAGSIAANGNMQGIAPNVGLVPYKVFHTGNGSSTAVIEAIITAARDDMDVINLSVGTYKSINNKEEKAVYEAYKRALKYAKKENSFVVASAGTENIGLDISNPKKLAEARGFAGDTQYHMPGGLKDAYTVAATNKDNLLTEYSNYGKNVSIGAPGGDYGPLANQGIFDARYMTLTTYPTNLTQSYTSMYAGFSKGYEFMIGTSLAVPKVSATAALIIAEYQEQFGHKPSVKEIEEFLNKGASKTESTNKYGAGIVDAYESLSLVNTK